jgi:hypothetical protein
VTITVQARVVPVAVLAFCLSCSEYSKRMASTATTPMIHRLGFDTFQATLITSL